MHISATHPQHHRPTWLDLAHRRLDDAVFAAYGWNSDLSDEEILEKLLVLNVERGRRRLVLHPARGQIDLLGKIC